MLGIQRGWPVWRRFGHGQESSGAGIRARPEWLRFRFAGATFLAVDGRRFFDVSRSDRHEPRHHSATRTLGVPMSIKKSEPEPHLREKPDALKTSRVQLSRRKLIAATGAGLAGAALCGLDGLGCTPKQSVTLAEPPKDKMTYRVHPLSKDKVSLLGFGCMRFPVRADASSASGPEIDEAESLRFVDYAIEHGVNYFDTAWRYHGGQSEVVIGKALKRYPRESFYLADKMPGILKPTLDEAKDIFKTQLERCQVEYFDYYLLHSISTLAAYKEVYEDNGVLDYILEEKAAGRIRNLGWSFHGTEEALEYILTQDKTKWDFAMVQLNYHDLLHEYTQEALARRNLDGQPAQARWLLEKLAPTGIPLVIMEPLLGGRLARLNRKAISILQQERPDASVASWAFRYAAQLPNVFTVLSGMTFFEHLQDNIRTYAPFEPLSGTESAALQKAVDIFVTQENIPCTACGYCMPCAYGIDIPSIFTHYNNCVDDQLVPKVGGGSEERKKLRAFLSTHDRAIPDTRQAIRCTFCGQCKPHCPQRIDIPDKLAELGRMTEQFRNQG